MRGMVWLTILFGAMNVGMAVSQSAVQTPAQSQAPAQPVAGMDMPHSRPSGPVGPLKITFGDKSAEWTAATLSVLPHTTITAYNEHAKADQTYSGVELIELLKPLGVADKPHGKEFRLYLVAEGSDGYQVVYSIGEVTPDVHIGKVLVADAQDGKPIADDGPLKLVAVGEKRPARWVRNLVAIRVLTAQ
ncbi:MAG: hypothetical protein ABSD67_25915 [Terracidiphilus sp.]